MMGAIFSFSVTARSGSNRTRICLERLLDAVRGEVRLAVQVFDTVLALKERDEELALIDVSHVQAVHPGVVPAFRQQVDALVQRLLKCRRHAKQDERGRLAFVLIPPREPVRVGVDDPLNPQIDDAGVDVRCSTPAERSDAPSAAPYQRRLGPSCGARGAPQPLASPTNPDTLCRSNSDPRAMDLASVDSRSSPDRKIALFRSLFRGREDVYPRRFESVSSGRSGYAPACANEWVPGVCGKPRIKCAECPNRGFLAVTDNEIRWHLSGADDRGKPFVMGVYPMLLDETCHFLAVDFDGPTWAADAGAYLDACAALDVPSALERSRSGVGGHVWIFFDHAVPAGVARRLGALLLTEAMDKRPDLGFRSYDRFFPSQDTLPRGGFGNLIALPLQRRLVAWGTASSSTRISSRSRTNGPSSPHWEG